MPILTEAQVAAFAREAGWPADIIPLVVAVAKRESSLNSDAVGPLRASPPVGLMQVRAYPGRPSAAALKNPVTNLREARRIYLEAGSKWGPNPWAVCSNASCSNLAGEARAIAKRVFGDEDYGKGLLGGEGLRSALGGALDPSEIAEQFGDTSEMGLDATSGALNAIGTLADIVTNPEWWKRIGIGAAGVALIAVAGVAILKDVIPSPAGTAAKVLK